MKQMYSVLCVDDDVSVLKVLNKILSQSSFRVVTTTDVLYGINILKEKSFDVIVADYNMPDLNGINFLKQAKTITPDAIRIILTGYSDINITIAAINEGEIHKYITKPLNNKEFITSIRDAINRKKKIINNKSFDNAKQLKREIKNIRKVLESTNFSTIKALSKAIELKDRYTRGHCERVLSYAYKLGIKRNLKPKQLEDIKYAATLHDIGKIGVPSNILNKPGKLTPGERELIECHPVDGARITSEIDFLTVVSRIILEHHEQFNGHGYPGRKAGNEILIESRIISIADVYDALVSDRAYRPAIPEVLAREILIREKGKMFDPELIDEFIINVL
jgi:putative two-component system response regulator